MQKQKFLALVMVCSLSCPAAGTVYNLTPGDDWYSIISGSGLSPGDEVILHEGTYSSSSWLPMGHQGTAEQPIVVRAAEGERVIITKSRTTINNMDIKGARYLTLRGLEITGADAAIRIMKNDAGEHAKFITIENCYIHHTGGNAITCNHTGQTYEGMIFRSNEISHTGGHGEGFYLGSNYNGSQFYNGLIEGNYIHDLIWNNSSFQGDGIEIKDGSYNNIVRDNVIHDVNYPGIIVYGTCGQGDRNIVERNVIWNSGDHGIQAAADAIVRNNIIWGSAYDGIHSHHHQSAIPGNLDIYHNTVFADPGKRTVYIYLDEPASGPVVVANNAVHNAGSGGISVPGGTIVTGNVVSTDPSADFTDWANHDYFPLPGSALIGAGNVAYVAEDDFNGTLREGALDVGAYLYDPNGNPGWPVQAGFKIIPIPRGDANKDGKVDGLDYNIWSLNYLMPGGYAEGNFNGDAVVDGLDYNIWSLNYDGGAGAQVPEPSCVLLLAVGVWALRRRRRGSATV
jgi:hypothetical protein